MNRSATTLASAVARRVSGGKGAVLSPQEPEFRRCSRILPVTFPSTQAGGGKPASPSRPRRSARFAIGFAFAGIAVSAAPASPDRWAELAAAHEPRTCVRCRPHPKAAASVAEVVRRLRREATTPTAPAPIGGGDLTAELGHVAAADADDQPRQAMRIADELTPRDVRAGAAFAAALPGGRTQDAAMLVVVSIWMRADRRALLEWAQGLAEAPARRSALDEVARRLVAADVREAQTMATSLPAGPGRDEALCAVARLWAKIDPPAALAWVQGFADSTHKARMLEALSE